MREKQSKATQERHARMLDELLKLPGNDRCADCKSKNPRWASHSLGLFLCIRCASLHRKMGTHVSKVKSVSMDCWSLEEIQTMKRLGGNDVRNNEINKNPQKYTLPVSLDDDAVVEKYIRDKWERRLFSKTDKQPSTGSILSSTSTDELATPTISSTNSSISINNNNLFAGQVTYDTNPFTMTMNNNNNYNYNVTKNPYNPFNQPVTQIHHSTTNPFLHNNNSNSNNPFLYK